MAEETITAAELMARLEKDPDFLAKRAEQDEKVRKLEEGCQADEASLVRELNKSGFEVDSVWDLVNNQPHPVLERRFVGEYKEAYPILVKHLDVAHHERIREGIIRALSEPAAYAVAAQVLIKHFQLETRKSLRWVLANALESMLPKSELDQYPQVNEVLRAGYL